MAILTTLSREEAESIGALYGLEVAACEGLLAGSVNSNVALTLVDGKRIFLRIYEEQGADGAEREARLLEYLAMRAIPAPRPLRLKDGGGWVTEHRGKAVAVFPWLDGQMVCQAGVTKEVAYAVGRALGELHVAGRSFEGASPNRFDLGNLERRMKGLRGQSLEPELAADVKELDETLVALRESKPTIQVEPILIHGDLFRDNVLWKEGCIVALIDFESASMGNAAFDFAVTMLAWCFGETLNPVLTRALGEGYQSVRAFSAEEGSTLFYEASFAALRFSITRVTDYELRKGVSAYRDYRRFVARQRVLRELGPKGLQEAIGY